MVSICKIDDFPAMTRTGHQTEEVIMVRDALKESIENNYSAFELQGVPKDSYGSWQQRIRTQAHKLGVNVEIRFSAESETLAFRTQERVEKVKVADKPSGKNSK